MDEYTKAKGWDGIAGKDVPRKGSRFLLKQSLKTPKDHIIFEAPLKKGGQWTILEQGPSPKILKTWDDLDGERADLH